MTRALNDDDSRIDSAIMRYCWHVVYNIESDKCMIDRLIDDGFAAVEAQHVLSAAKILAKDFV